jgi:hypothetical protein
VKPIIKNCDRFVSKDLVDSYKINSVLPNVGLAFGFVPFESQALIVVTVGSYVNIGCFAYLHLTSKSTYE